MFIYHVPLSPVPYLLGKLVPVLPDICNYLLHHDNLAKIILQISLPASAR